MACGSCRRGPRPLVVREVIAAVERIVAEVIKRAKLKDRTGGYFCLLNHATGEFLIRPRVIGMVTDRAKRRKYQYLCMEKAIRLSVMEDERGVDVTSWQSRDEEKQRYGGAVLTETDYIFSFSGLPELCDEAAMIIAAVKSGQMSYGRARKCARFSNNLVDWGF